MLCKIFFHPLLVEGKLFSFKRDKGIQFFFVFSSSINDINSDDGMMIIHSNDAGGGYLAGSNCSHKDLQTKVEQATLAVGVAVFETLQLQVLSLQRSW